VSLPLVMWLCIPVICVLVIIAALKQMLPIWAAIVIVIALLVFHGYFGGLPGLIGETIFQHSLKVGITRADVIQLERRLGGEDGIPDSSLSETGGAPGTIDVRFADYAALYGTSGKWFQLDFGPDWRLSSWKVESWGSFL
jgi:hypothetical protein